jgi:hypothetical protein
MGMDDPSRMYALDVSGHLSPFSVVLFDGGGAAMGGGLTPEAGEEWMYVWSLRSLRRKKKEKSISNQ